MHPNGRKASDQTTNLPAGTHHPRPFGSRRLRSGGHGRAQDRLLGGSGSPHDYRHVLAIVVAVVPGRLRLATSKEL